MPGACGPCNRTISMWQWVAKTCDVPCGAALEVEFNRRVVALFHLEGEIHAIAGMCPHQGASLSEGRTEGCVVACPWHGWRFDVTTGENIYNPSLKVDRFPVRIAKGNVYLSMP